MVSGMEENRKTYICNDLRMGTDEPLIAQSLGQVVRVWILM